MNNLPRLTLEETEAGAVLRLTGDWRLSHLLDAQAALAFLPKLEVDSVQLDGSGLEGLDSAAALVLMHSLHDHGVAWGKVALQGFDARRRALLDLVAERMAVSGPGPAGAPGWLARLGEVVVHVLRGGRDMLAFVGRTSQALGEVLVRPTRLRPRELFMQLEVVGLEALAIVGLMTLLVGVVFAHLLAIQIEKYGANIFIVDGVALALARELAPLLTAILVAGRSGAAFTAQIGAMKVTEEVDAITTLGLSPFHVLVLPRLLAIVIAMPLLTFFADLLGLLGASFVAAQQLDITLYTFFSRLKDVLPLEYVLYGLYKAPVFAAAIALIACRNGFAVSRDARSVGERTTTTVVQSLVAVILINAAFALASPEYRG
ncbi:MAG: ABC transporter permease [Thiobacillus sp.]|nr:ABC transporter permease [Thiobacillus sp.]